MSTSVAPGGTTHLPGSRCGHSVLCEVPKPCQQTIICLVLCNPAMSYHVHIPGKCFGPVVERQPDVQSI